MISAKEFGNSLLHLFFPRTCAGCGSDISGGDSSLCLKCIAVMPHTGFEWHTANPVGKKFWGRIDLAHATAQYYFSRESIMQRLMHQFKYRGNKELGLQLGRMMGQQLRLAGLFDADILIPLPLFASKQRKRGFNQATVLCEGISESLLVPVMEGAVIRSQHTDTQTRKGRIERWQNMEGKFILQDPSQIAGRHILLVDDVITTGATLEACGMALLAVPGVTLSIATLCYATKT